jgi:hypothetical protein
MTTITPTVGRKVWFYDAQGHLVVNDHSGQSFTRASIPLRNPADSDCHGIGAGDFATWMPYQVGQAKQR